jgi:hypothetical protein
MKTKGKRKPAPRVSAAALRRAVEQERDEG